MSTRIDTVAGDSKDTTYEDLQRAIGSFAFVQAKNGVAIVSGTGTREKWLFDFRALMLQSHWLNRYAELFWEKYESRLPFQVGGLETAGIALVAAIVMKGVERGTPVNGFYIRKSRKRQGLMKFIEGALTNESIIFVDDLINSGQSVNKNIDILIAEGKKVTDVFVMLAFRAEDAYVFFKEKGITLSSLFTIADFGLPLLSARAPEIPRESFDVVWCYKAPGPSFHLVVEKSAPALDNTHVFFGCDDGVFRALNQNTGAVSWQFRVGKHPPGKGILSSPIVHDGVVYFGAYDGSTYALRADTGELLWRNDDADWVGSSPHIARDENILFIGLEFGLIRKRGGIAALDMRTGERRWAMYHTGLTHGSPLYIQKESLVVIGSNDGVMYAYDALSGSLRWSFASGGEIKSRPAYDPTRRAVIFGAMNGMLYSLSASDGSPLNALELGAGIYSTPLVHEEIVYVSSLDKCIYALDAATWKSVWTYETSGRIFASPTIANESLWIGSNDGRLYELNPKTGVLKTSFQTTERIVNAIAVWGESLFVPTVANEMYCLTKKKDAPK